MKKFENLHSFRFFQFDFSDVRYFNLDNIRKQIQ